MTNITYISAGAGSGKTTRIINELVGALTTLRPSQIIMTTFTRAAAQEMRERAKKELLALGMTDKANEMDAAMIGTIHAVCLNFLQKYWYLAGISPDTQQMDENDFQFYVDMSLFKLVSEKDMQEFEQWRKELDMKVKNGKATVPYVSYWRDWLRKMVDKVRYYHIDKLTESRDLSIQAIRDVWPKIAYNKAEYERCKKELIANLPHKKDGGLTSSAATRLEYLKDYDPIAEHGKIGINSLKGIEEQFEAWAEAARRGCYSDAAKEAAINIINKLFDILAAWQSDYAAYKKEKKMLDFNDMEVEFCRLLDNPEVQAELQRYQLVLVDEFQDCNPMQIDIFSRIADIVAAGGGRSIWVGDPKQAIYGFRGTDTTLVKETSEQIVNNVNGCKRYTLDTNYRSQEGLVNYVNKMFLPIFTAAPFKLDKMEIVLIPGRVGGKDVLGSQACLPQPWTVLPQRESYDLSNIAHNIKQLVESKDVTTYVQPKGSDTKRPAQYGDIAVLVRKNGTVAKFAKLFQQHGIPFFATDDKDNESTPIENALLMALVQYKLSKDYRPHLRADILHLLKDMSTEEIVADYLGAIKVSINANGKRQYNGRSVWKDGDVLIEQIEAIVNGYHGKSIYELMAMFVDRLKLYDAVAKWENRDIRQSHISRMLQLAQSYDQHCEIMGADPTYADFAKYIEDAQAKSELNMDSNTVKILTIHKSKGLEWPIVIYYDLDNDFAQDDKILEREYFGVREQRKEDKKYWLRVFPTLSPIAKADLFANEDYFKESRERVKADEKRLCYVGLTRARDMLITVAEANDAPTYTVELPSGTYQTINTDNTQQEGSNLANLVSPSKNTSGKLDIQTETVEAKRISLKLSEEEQIRKMSTIGTCIHNIYAAYNPADRTAAIAMAEGIIRSYALSDVIKAEEVIDAIESLYAYLNKQYGEPKAVTHEVPFSIKRENGQLLRGEIDLLWHTPDGVVLVDYKNTKKEEANPEHYAGQMAACREAIEASDLKLKGIVLFYATLGKIINLTIH